MSSCRGGSGGDADLRALVTTIEGERRTGNGHASRPPRGESHGIPDLPGGRARLHDIVWTLTRTRVADRLIRQCGWSPDDYETWLGDQLAAVRASRKSEPRTRHEKPRRFLCPCASLARAP